MTFVRGLKFIFTGIVLLVLAWFGYALFLVVNDAGKDQAQPADAILVLGAAQYNGVPSPVLKARLDHAADLWNDGVSRTIIVTGGAAEGDLFTEASASADYLGTLGIPDDNVLREVDGTNTWNSLQAASRFMAERDIDSVVLVSDPFHSARVRLMADDLGLDARVSPTQDSPIRGDTALPYYFKEVISVAVGKSVGWDKAIRLEAVLGRNGLI